MDFNMKKLASGAGVFFTRAVQFTEERLGQAERTEPDADLERLAGRADVTRLWTERICRQTEVLLRPNPGVRMEEFLYEKLDRTAPQRPASGQLLGRHMEDAARSLGPELAYGRGLLLVGACEQRLGRAEREFSQVSAVALIGPLRDFLEGDWSLITKERRLLENRRLDLDACKARLRRAQAAESKAAAGDELQRAQAEFDQQAEVTKLLLGDISSTHVNHLRCLHEFVEAQAAYYKQCHLHMEDLQKELACGSAGGSGQQGEQSGGGGDPPSPPPGSRRARVLFDYDAADASELSLYADQLITVYTVPGMDSDWLIGERENHRGRVPVTYLELLS
uniref:Endophilin-B2 n=1 Tax=Gadus morhua TaxID=8049 RepID=A0A8C5ATK6_GADMO